MTATECLRQLLDEQGVEWAEALTDLSRQTHWGTERYWCAFTEWNGTVDIADTLTVYHVTPEQAVEATLGRGTCDLQAENERLREENDRLRNVLDIGATEAKEHIAEGMRLIAENEKLRKLARDMWPHVRHRSRMCQECDLPCDASDECLLYEPMRQRMRELGIEVNDG